MGASQFLVSWERTDGGGVQAWLHRRTPNDPLGGSETARVRYFPPREAEAWSDDQAQEEVIAWGEGEVR